MFTLWYYNSWEFAMRNCVTAFKLVLFVAWQVNKSRDGLLGQGWQLYTEIQQNKKIVDCLAWSGCYFLCIEKKRKRWGSQVGFLCCCFFFFFKRQKVAAIIFWYQPGFWESIYVNFFFHAAIHRWAWSGYPL